MNRQKLRNRNIRGLFTALIFFTCIAVNICIANADEGTVNVTLKTAYGIEDNDRGNYQNINKDIKDFANGSDISLSTDNPEVAGIMYKEEDYSSPSSDITSKRNFVDNIILTGVQLKYIVSQKNKDVEEGTVTDVYLYAKRAGVANISMTNNNSGVTKLYHVTVKATKPKFDKKLVKSFSDSGRVTDSGIFLDESISLGIEASDFAKVTMACNKDNGLKVCYGGAYKGKKWVEKKTSLGKTAKEIPVDEYYTFIAKKTGNLKITIKIEQDGKTYTKVYKLNVAKYKNPFQNITIGGKDYTKYFEKNRLLTDTKQVKQKTSTRMSVKNCKHTLGAKFKINWKKGYKLKKITYVNAGEYAVMRHTLNKNATTLPKKFWELYITYTDKDGKTWTNVIHYSSYVISPY